MYRVYQNTYFTYELIYDYFLNLIFMFRKVYALKLELEYVHWMLNLKNIKTNSI